MNYVEKERVLKRLNCFDGVYSCDNLPENAHLLVSSTDLSDKPGRHWICIYRDRSTGIGEYFDSFGRRPNDDFERYMNSKCCNWTFNNVQLQSVVSRFCGLYCIYFCLLRSRNVDMRKIVSSLTSDTAYNDAIVHSLLCRHIKYNK